QEEAARAVASTRYPPEGIRGVSVSHRANMFGTVPDYFAQSNKMALFSKPELLNKALAGEAVSLKLVSVGLLTASNIFGKEGTMVE
ncbi:hypothetical protein MJN76_29755, partial [Salmonella enterica subsp. enterica serovar Anatum]|nr:hypothetical protein [Salmonella enterica subsp. enterica serovar Anatum]